MIYSEEEFIERFRLKKECVLELLNDIEENLEPKQTNVSSISPLNQLLIGSMELGVSSKFLEIYLEFTKVQLLAL